LNTEHASRRTWLVLAAILAVGLLLRGLYLHEIADTTEFSSPAADAAFHDYWARALITGDWSAPAQNPNPFISSVPFVRPPGYPYFLAASYALTGGSYLGARIVQLGLGLVNIWLAFLLGRAIFGRTVGLITAALVATHWALIYFENELHAPVLLISLSLGLMLVLVGWYRRPAWWRLLVAGLLLGAMALVRPNVLVFAPFAAGWVWWNARRTTSPRRALLPAAVLAVGTIAAILPATVRNLVVANDFVLISANGAINLHIGNNDSADGVTTRIPDLQEVTGQSGWSCFAYDQIVQGLSEKAGRPLKYSDVSRHFWHQGLSWITSHPGRFLSLTARRAALFWGPAEVSNNRALAIEKENSGVLHWLPGLPIYLALALLGAIMLVQARRRPATAKNEAPPAGDGPLISLVALYVGATFLSFLPFLVASRFRAPILPFVFLFAAYGLYRLALPLGARRWGGAAKLALAGVALFLLANHPFTDYKADRSWWHTDRADAFVREGDSAAALREYQLALQENPGFVDAHVGLANLLASLGRYDDAIGHYYLVRRNRPDRLDVRVGLATVLNLTGKSQQAVVELRDVLKRNPDTAQARFELGRALTSLGRYEEAEKELREAIRLAPGYSFQHTSLGLVLEQLGRHREAIAEFRHALLLDRSNADAQRGLGKALCSVDSVQAGVQAYERAVELDPGSAVAAVELARYYFGEGDMANAARWFETATRREPDNAAIRSNFGSVLANLGRYDQAIAQFEAALRLAPGDADFRTRLERTRALRDEAARGGP